MLVKQIYSNEFKALGWKMVEAWGLMWEKKYTFEKLCVVSEWFEAYLLNFMVEVIVNACVYVLMIFGFKCDFMVVCEFNYSCYEALNL